MSSTNAAHSGQGPHLSVPSTPARDRDKHVFPSSSHSQPSPTPSLRHTTSSVSNNFPAGTPPSIQISSQTVSVEALLKQHASASDPRTAALEQAVNDRNVLSAQNAQLWKLIEKQRAGYNQILKELERIRGERGGKRFESGHFRAATQLFEELLMSESLEEFLTLKSYQLLD